MSQILPVIFLLIIVVINFALALIVFTNNPKSSTNRLFSSLNLILIVWLIINFLSLQPFFYSYSLPLIRFTIFYAALISLLFYLLSLTIPKNKIPLSKNRLIFIVLLTAVTMVITISPYAFTGINYNDNSPKPVAGPGMLPFSLVSTTFSVLAIITLFKRIKKTTGTEREQLLYVAFGILMMLTAIILTVLVPVLFFNQNFFVSMLPLYTLFFLAPTTYAIIRHRLMDIRLVVTKTVSFTLLISVFALLYALLFANLSQLFNTNTSHYTSIAISTVLSLVMVLSFQPLRSSIEKLTDKIFYKDHYNANKLLHSLARIMAGTYDLDLLSQQLLKELITQMRLSKGLFVLVEEGVITHQISDKAKELSDLNSETLLRLYEGNKTLIYEDISEQSEKTLMRSMDFGYITELKSGDKKIGLVCLGTKLSGDIYTTDDIRLLETFSSEAAVALANALAIEHTKKFNIILQQEVDKATKDLQNANSRLQVLDKLKDEFVSLASHELRTPMTAIKSYLWLFLQDKESTLGDKQKKYIERAYQASDRLIALVNDMLNVSRIESGRMNLMIKPFDLPKLISEVIDELKPSAEKQNVSIILNPLNDNLPNVLGDSNKIREVLINLIGNSIKFTNQKGTITVEIIKSDNTLVTKVKDTGKGISKEDLHKLFHKFQTVGNNYLTKMNTQGTGLGLYLSKSIVEMNGGKIWAESEGLGKGAVFSFSLKTV